MVPPPMQLSTSLAGLAPLNAIFFFLVTTCITLRFVARHKQNVKYGPDDWLMIPTWFFFTGLVIASIYSMANHFAGIYAPADKRILLAIHPTMLKTYFSIDVLGILVFGFVKLSVLFFYRRIFCVGHTGLFNYVIWGAIGIVAAWEITFFVMTFIFCGTNLNALWGTANTGVCTILFPYYWATTVSDFLLDLIIVILPLPKIWTLHTNVSRKLAVTGVFLFALAGLGASCARMVITIHLVTVGKAVDDEDSFQSNTQWQYFIILEAGLTIVAANLPTLWYFSSGVTPASVLRSVRSLVSLRSTNKSNDSGLVSKTAKQLDSGSQSHSSRDASFANHEERSTNLPNAYKNVAYPEGHVETMALSDLHASRPEGQGIQVKKSVTHSESRV